MWVTLLPPPHFTQFVCPQDCDKQALEALLTLIEKVCVCVCVFAQGCSLNNPPSPPTMCGAFPQPLVRRPR